MNTNRLLLFVSVLVSIAILGISTPTYADVINASFKSGVKKTNCTPKGRNSNVKAQKTVFDPRSPGCKTPEKIGRFKHPRMGGLRIDACVLGDGWKRTDPKRCDASRLTTVGNNFCRLKGYKKSILIAKTSHKGKHAILSYKKSKPKNSYWKRRSGHIVIKSVFCQ